MKRFLRFTTLLVAIPCAAQDAQRPPNPDLDVRLFPLRYLTPSDAAKLISPFVFEPSGGVFEAGGGVQGITVRATRGVLNRVDSLLKLYDEAPPTINFRFQLLVASDSNWTVEGLPSEVLSSLRSLFRYNGYRLVAQGAATANASAFSLTLSSSDGARYTVDGEVWRIASATSAGSRGRAENVQLKVWLSTAPSVRLLSTGLTVPIGETVVIGTAAGGTGRVGPGQGQTLILIVRPEYGAPGAR